MSETRNHHRSLGALVLAATLVLAPASVSLADDHDDPGVDCYLGDDLAEVVEPGDEVTCEAWGLDPELPFDWELYYLDTDTEEVIDEDGAIDLDVDEDGVGVFSFTVPADTPSPSFYEGWVVQGDEGEYEEAFYGLVLVLPEMTCAPDPVVAGAEVICTFTGLAPGQWFAWGADLLDDAALLEALEEFEWADAEGVDDLAGLDALLDIEDGELGDPYAEGEGEANENGVGQFSYTVPSDTDAVAYLSAAVTEFSYALYLGGVAPAQIEVETPATPPTPVQEPTPVAEGEAPVVVQRPTRVDTGAGGTSEAGVPAGALTLAALALLGLSGAVLRQRRDAVR